MRPRWPQRLILAMVAAAVSLVPFIGSLAHGHAHHEAQEAHLPVADGDHASAGPTVAPTHQAGDHQHLPSAKATLSRIGPDWLAAPVTTMVLVASVTRTSSAPAPGPDDPRPRRTHDPPAAPRAPPIA